VRRIERDREHDGGGGGEVRARRGGEIALVDPMLDLRR
jgi:hypothetical protein